MSLLLTVLRIYTPTWLKRRQLAELFDCTSSGFGVEPPSTTGLSFDECLLEYACFTASEAKAAIQRGDAEALRDRLYPNAYELGRKLRRRLRVASEDEAMAATRLLYRGLRIDLRGPTEARTGGEIEVGQCFFARFYSGEVCQVVSALDAGLMAGLSGGHQLTFYQRMTEGHDRCRARLEEAPR